MKTLAIQRDIVSKFNNLSDSAKIPFDKKNSVAYIWGINSKVGNKNGFISQWGDISIKANRKPQTGNLFKDIAIDLYNGITKFFDAEIKITNNNIRKIKKPLFSNWTKTLDKINNLLEYTSKNINNKDVVENVYKKSMQR